MIPAYFANVIAAGAEVSIIAEPRQVIVDCRGCEIHDEHLVDIARDPDLEWLWLNGCSVTNSGVSKLSGSNRLEWLDIGSTRVTGSILHIVPSLPRLGGIGLAGIRQVDSNIEFLMDHPALDVVDFSFSDVTRRSLRQLLVRSRVTHVDVTGTGIIASDLADLDDIDAEPQRTVSIILSDSESLGIVMELRD